MGMPDRSVNKGMLDKPGMMNMGHEKMDMSHPKNHATDKSHSTGMQMTSPKPAAQTGENSTDTMIFSGHTLPEHKPVDRSGKQHAYRFGFLATDISSAGNLAVDGMSKERPWPPYEQLKATHKTSFSENKKVREIRLTLGGDMERYVWFFNNKPLSESDSILIHEGEVTRFIMINRTMMHHPMHLHGHFLCLKWPGKLCTSQAYGECCPHVHHRYRV